ncbi:MAG: hypothetical protein ACK4JE_04275, partial [Endomicrobiia bacterium]
MYKKILPFSFLFVYGLLFGSYPNKITFGDSEIYSFIASANIWQSALKSSLDTSIISYSPEIILHNEYKILGSFFETIDYIYSSEYPELYSLGVEPQSGQPGSNFVYKVKYIQKSNEPPKTGYPKLIIMKDNSQIEGSPFNMELESGIEPKTGLIYSCTVQLSIVSNNYSFYFIAYDQYNLYTQTEINSGPEVTLKELQISSIEIGGINFNNEVYGVSPYVQPVINFNKEINITKNINSIEIHSLSNKEIISGSINQTGTTQIKFIPERSLSKGQKYKITVKYDQKIYSLVFYTILDHLAENIVTANPDGKTKINLKKNTLPEDGFIIINTNPTNNLILEANQKIKSKNDKFIQIIPNTETEFICFLSPEKRIVNLNSTAEIFIPYIDQDIDGIVDNSSPKIISKTLKICKLNEEKVQWEELTSFVDEKNCYVSAKTDQLGL